MMEFFKYFFEKVILRKYSKGALESSRDLLSSLSTVMFFVIAFLIYFIYLCFKEGELVPIFVCIVLIIFSLMITKTFKNMVEDINKKINKIDDDEVNEFNPEMEDKVNKVLFIKRNRAWIILLIGIILLYIKRLFS